MKTSKSLMMFVAAACCLLLSQAVEAQTTNNFTSIGYNLSANLISGMSTTELDYSMQDYYQARVEGRIKDQDGNLLALGSKTDTYGEGSASVTLEVSGVSGTQYTMEGTHRARAYISDPAFGTNYYNDFYNYGFYSTYNGEVYRLHFYPFTGPGPNVVRTMRDFNAGKTYDVTDVDLPPRFTIEAASTTDAQIARSNGSTTLNVEVSVTHATPVGAKVVVEIHEARNPNQIPLTFPFQSDATVTAEHQGHVIIVPFTIRTPSDNTVTGGSITFRATIVGINPPQGYSGPAIQNGANPQQPSTFVSNPALKTSPCPSSRPGCSP